MHQHTPFQTRPALPAGAPVPTARRPQPRMIRPARIARSAAPVIRPWPRAVRLGVMALGGVLGWAVPFTLAYVLHGSGLG